MKICGGSFAMTVYLTGETGKQLLCLMLVAHPSSSIPHFFELVDAASLGEDFSRVVCSFFECGP